MDQTSVFVDLFVSGSRVGYPVIYAVKKKYIKKKNVCVLLAESYRLRNVI